MQKSMLIKKINGLEEWLRLNPNHPDYTIKNRDFNHLQQQLKEQDINAAFPN